MEALPRQESAPSGLVPGPDIDREGFARLLEDESFIEPHYQPIVDLFFGEPLGYEVLSRGGEPFRTPARLFPAAERLGLSWELERACHQAAFRSIARLGEELRTRRFFLNVSPRVFSDTRFNDEEVCHTLDRLGIDRRRIVFEITESHQIDDYSSFEALIRRQVERGFQVAVDDFGAGHSGLITMVTVSPHYLKLDRELVHNIQDSPYKQQLVKAVLSFASSVESKLIAEGVETAGELEVLLRLGVRYAQGYLFARPEPELCTLPEGVLELVRRTVKRFHYPGISLNTSIASMVMRPPTFEVGGTLCKDLEPFFRRNPLVDHVVVLDGQRPAGLMPRQFFFTLAGGQFGFALVQNKYLEKVAKHNTLVVQEGIDITVLGHLAMEREQDDLYDPVIVTDRQGYFQGTITMKQLLTQSIKLEVQMAASANPLTGLPGNIMIQSWLQEALQAPAFTVIYGDLDNFKAFNDRYGFPEGDQMIKVAAQVIQDHAQRIQSEAHVGHVGGDDFTVIVRDKVEEDILRAICEDFDRRKASLFDVQDLERGFYESLDRQNRPVEVPLVTISLAVITSENVGHNPHEGQFGQIAASLKKKIKALNAVAGHSGYLLDSRRYR